MSRRVLIAVGILAALAGAGFGTYAIFFRGEPTPDAPVFVDDASKPLSPAEEFDRLAREDVVAMYGQCLSRYTREVKGGVRFTLEKQERVQGEPEPPKTPPVEVIEAAVRGDVPDPQTDRTAIEVLMKWKSGAKSVLGSEVHGTLFSERPESEQGLGGKAVTWRPKAFALKLSFPLAPNGKEARTLSRYCVRDAGLYRTMLRTHAAWKTRQATGELKVEYLGKKTPPQIGRECHVIRRHCPRVEIDAFEIGGAPSDDPKVIAAEGFTEVTVYIDAQRWLQVGSELYRAEPDGTRVLVGAYYFRDVQLNPDFPPDAFTVEALKK
jgi:hypothetical protein